MSSHRCTKDISQDMLEYEDYDYPFSDWQYEVVNGDTILGYWEWVEHQKEADSVLSINHLLH
jgi:hypothetical protein